jgi:hypothetical protein
MKMYIFLGFIFDFFVFTQSCLFSCTDTYDCKSDPAMEAGLAIRFYEITIEGADAAGNIGRDQCRVIIIPSNMTTQEADDIIQMSSVRYPIAATTDLEIMLETKTNIILKYMYDLSQAQIKEIKAMHSATNSAARDRGLIEADEGIYLTMHRENAPTDVVLKQMVKIKVELWMAIATLVGCVGAGVGIGFVLGRAKVKQAEVLLL